MDRKQKPSFWLWTLFFVVIALLLLIPIRGLFFPSGAPQSTTGQSAVQHLPGERTGESGNIAGKAGAPPAPYNPYASSPFPTSSAFAQPSAVAIKGIVLNEQDRTPIEGASVTIFAFASASSVVEKTTDPEGRFRIEAPPAYRYGIKANAEGFAPYQDESFIITRPAYELEIVLTPVLAVRGRVVDPQSNGIPGAVVTVQRENERPATGSTAATDSEGAFTLADIRRNGRYRFEAFHPGYDTLGMVTVTIPTESEIVLRMRPASATGSLVGTVVDKSRVPVAGAEISLFDATDGRAVSRIQTSREGTFAIPSLRAGYFLVRCAATGYLESRGNQGAIAVRVNAEARLDFTLDAGLQIRGIVVNQKGEPVMQATLSYKMPDAPRWESPQTITTDAEGRFQVSGLHDAQVEFRVQHRDYVELTARLRPSSQSQTLTLDGGYSVRGTVSDARGTAIEKYHLAFRSTTGYLIRNYPMTTTDGRFEVRGLPRDNYQVILRVGNLSYSGQLDLQASTEVFISLNPPEGRRGNNPMNIVKVR